MAGADKLRAPNNNETIGYVSRVLVWNLDFFGADSLTALKNKKTIVFVSQVLVWNLDFSWGRQPDGTQKQ